jgi:hypothetical protein
MSISLSNLPLTSLQCCYIVLVLQIIESSTFKCWELCTTPAGARGVWDVAVFVYPSCTDSVKPSLRFSCNFVVLMLPSGHFFLDICIYRNVGNRLDILLQNVNVISSDIYIHYDLLEQLELKFENWILQNYSQRYLFVL